MFCTLLFAVFYHRLQLHSPAMSTGIACHGGVWSLASRVLELQVPRVKLHDDGVPPPLVMNWGHAAMCHESHPCEALLLLYDVTPVLRWRQPPPSCAPDTPFRMHWCILKGTMLPRSRCMCAICSSLALLPAFCSRPTTSSKWKRSG